MPFKSVTIIEDYSDRSETIVYTHRGWIQENERVVWYVDKTDCLLLLADIKKYKDNHTYEIHPSSIVVLMKIRPGELFEEEDLEQFLTQLHEISLLNYLKQLVDRNSSLNLHLDRIFY
ncbi:MULTISPECIES: hypothetical protein [Bacillaceae]|uniref:Uncharacterized protein n=1 Tax=Alkalicoccobacillus plakortidis TaxID=444060 RepID=A0A9D5I237_9BACI|nr:MULTISPECIES: hypothetical protein [Bacillaceae]KQL58322.1 hypothetical protein AN965_04495 [Alkalicoccobacillus plakortidis]